MSAIFKSLKSPDVDIKEVGFNNAWLSLVSDFTTLQEPVVGTTPALGEKFTIGTSHVWAVGKEPIKMYVLPESIEGAGESTGDISFLGKTFKPKFHIKGDGAKVLEIIDALRNEEVILFLQNGCDTDSQIIQFGCKCDPARIAKFTSMTGNKDGGKVGYELEFKAYCKFFYKGTITSRP